MEETKDKTQSNNPGNNKNNRRRRDRRDRRPQDNPQPAAPVDDEQTAAPATVLPDEPDDNVATAEDIEAFMREHRKGRQEKKQVERENPEVEEYRSEENQIDPYLDPDPQIPWVKYEEPVFLSRGCRRCPVCYKPVGAAERRACSKVTSTNWMAGIRQPTERPFDIIEVQFKNNHKDFYRLPDGLEVTEGDVVAVEGQPGHDVGIVSLTGELCRLQMRKHRINPESESIRKVFRRAKESDLERWQESLRDEQTALLRTRKIVATLGLDMKVNDVEFQGDHSKAIFYYTADERVDFRELIKVLADEFHVRIEMKQIGVRQEAGKVGGLGTCGRELCCSTWLTNFKSVSTSSAKTQQIMPNPQKLAGQCGKLKCCLNFEYEVYADALKKFPPAGQALRFQKGLALYKKTDVLRGIMWYAYEGQNDLMAVTAESVKEIIDKNRRQEYPEQLEDYQVELMSTTALEQEGNAEEVEREIQRLSEGGNGVVGADQKKDDRPRGDRPHGDRPKGDRPRGDRPKGDRPRGERPKGERPKEERQQGERTQGERHERQKSSGDRSRREGTDRRSSGQNNRRN